MTSPQPKTSLGTDTGLKMDLLREGHAFSYLQTIRLLKIILGASARGDSQDKPLGDAIRTHPNLSLAFPPGDIDQIREIETDAHSGFEITANFLGLYGSSSPLPTFYTEDLMSEASDDESAARDFLDIINQRIFELFYAVCIKYRQTFQIIEANNPAHMERLFCLLGIGDKPIRDKVADPYRLLRYVGLMTQRPRSGMGLELILRDALDGLSVSIIPCVERKARIPEDQRVFLGSTAHSLGTNTTIGEEVTDRMGKFRIRIGPLDTAAFRSFYPGAENYALTCFLTEYYTVEQLEYDIEVVLAEGEAKTVCLGDTDRSRLGLNTWIFSSDRIGEMRKVYSPAA